MENKKIDRQVAEKVMGWVSKGKWWVGSDNYTCTIYASNPTRELWQPSTNIAHAFEADDKMFEMGYCLYLKRRKKGNYTACYCLKDGTPKTDWYKKKNPATAISLAQLAALEAIKER